MANTNGKIESPIRTSADVNAVLKAGSNNVGYLCANSHGKINKWSKYKPVRYAKESGLTEEEFKSVNFGMDCQSTTLAQAKLNPNKTWVYNPPNRSTDPKRLGDFRNYEHNSQIPMVFGFSFDEKEYMYNTVTTTTPSISIKVSYRQNATTASNGIGVVGLNLTDMGATEVTTGTFGNYVPCVTTCVNNTLYVANAEDTLGRKFSTGINDMSIVLGNFNLITDAWVSDSNGTGYPENATEKYKMTLYPRINCFTPSVKGGVHTSLTTTTGTNGHYTSGTYPFLGVPDGTPLILRKYKRVPLKADYSYFKDVSTTPTLSQGIYVLNNAAYTSQCGNWGGKIVYFKDRRTIIEMMVQLENLENVPFSVVGAGIEDSAGIWNKNCTIAFKKSTDTSTNYTNTIAIGAKEKLWVQVRITYEAGCSTANYTFTSLTSPSYGTCRPKLSLKVVLANGNGAAFTPTEDTIKEIRWR